MAERHAYTAGNWSDSATWKGGLIPTSGDDVYSNFQAVTIDQDITVNSLNSFGSSGNGAREFTRTNTEYFDLGDNSLFEAGDNDAWWAGWVWLNSKAGDHTILSKYAFGSNEREFLLYRIEGNDRFRLSVSSTGSNVSFVLADTFGATIATAWQFVIAYHDSVNDLIGISVNGGAFDTASFTGGIYQSAAKYTVGGYYNTTGAGPTSTHDGRLARLAMGKSPPGGIAAIATTIRDRLWGNGYSILYSDLTSQEKTDYGLIWWADGNEASGDLVDQHGGVNGTNINTVTNDKGPNNAESGGSFTFNSTRTINASTINAGTSTCLTCGTASGDIATINGNITGGVGGTGNYGVRMTGSGILNINGDIIGGSGGGTNYGLYHFSTAGTVNVNGNVTGGSSGTNVGAWVNSSGTLTVIGDITGGGGTDAFGIRNFSTGSVDVTGNVYGGSNSAAYGIHNQSTGTIAVMGNVVGQTARGIHQNGAGIVTVIGNVTGGLGLNAMGVRCGSGTVTITGDVTGGSHTGAQGAYVASAAIVTINGNVTADAGVGLQNVAGGTVTITGNATAGSNNSAIINSAATGTVIVLGNMVSSSDGYDTVGGKVLYSTSAPQKIIYRRNNSGSPGDARTLYTSNAYPGL